MVRAEQEQSLQSMVDALSIALNRPILLDDHTLAPLSSSAQWGVVDRVRSESILRRRAAPEVREALLAQGIADATNLVRTASVPELGMEERVCVPVRANGELLAYIWILDPGSTLTPADLDCVTVTARSVGELLRPSSRRTVPDDGALLQALCSSNPAEREPAVELVREKRRLPDTPIAVGLFACNSQEVDALDAAQRVVRRLSIGHGLAGSMSEGAGLLVAMEDPVLRPLHDGDVAAWLHRTANAELSIGQSSRVGLDSLDRALRQAQIALRVAKSEAGSSAAAWSTLGADRLAAQLPQAALTDVPESLAHFLLEEVELSHTLEAFLDHAGDVKATAAVLSLHRSGLYYRLHRIEDLTGLRLDSGDDRLLAHMAIRAHQLAARATR